MARRRPASKSSPSEGADRSPAPGIPPAPVPGAALVTAHRWAWILLSLIVPFAGIFIALFLYDVEDREVRKVGRNCLLVGFSVWVLFPVLVLSALLLLGAFTMVSWFSQMVPLSY